MRIATIGIGSWGISVAKHYSLINGDTDCIAIHTNKDVLENTNLPLKVKLSKRLAVEDAVGRAHPKLKKALSGCDIAFFIGNPADLHDPYALPLIAEYIRELEVVPVGIVIKPCGKFERKAKQRIRGSLNLLSLASAVVEIPQENIPHYAECNENWLRYVIDHDTGREIVQEQAEFRDWHNNYISFLQDSPLEIDVGLFFVMRLLEMITAPYVCASKKSICNILSQTGKVHLSSVCAKGRNEYRDRAEYKGWLLGWRAAYNDLLHTTSHAATGMLLTLTIPKTLSQKEFKYVLLRVYGYADEFVDIFFNVQVTSSKSDAIYAKVLATGTWDENEEH